MTSFIGTKTTQSKSEAAALVTFKDVIRPTTVIPAERLSKLLGAQIIIASETFQQTGSFKFRAAYNLALKVPQKHIIAASSGNFGQALACACRLLEKSCTIVMPFNSARVKVDAVREFGGMVEFVDTKRITRAERVNELAREDPDAYIASAYDDPLIIEGNSSLGEELLGLGIDFDYIIAPVGGGGLSSGIIKGIRRVRSQSSNAPEVKVIGAEPAIANDAARSLKAGYIIRNESEPQTIADGARIISLGKCNWEILKVGLSGIVEVPEENIKEGVRLLYNLANLKAEPTGALSIGAVLTNPEMFRDKSVCCIVSGGNVDAEVYRSLIQ